MRKILFTLSTLLVFLVASIGCHGQIPPTAPKVVQLSWNAPTANSGWAGCTTALPCTYAVSRVLQVGSSCPATTGTTYGLLASGIATTTYTDSTASPGLTYCYIAQTQQSDGKTPPGTLTSQPSNTTSISLPGIPLAPSLNPAQSAELSVPTILAPEPTLLSELPTITLTAKLVKP